MVSVIQLISTIALISVTILWVKRQIVLQKAIFEQNIRIQHLTQLNEVIALGMNPAVRMFYNKLRDAGPIKSAEQASKMAQETTSEMFQGVKSSMEAALKKEEDPIRRERMVAAVKELEDMYSLYSTVGPDSSEEYVAMIGQNIAEISTKIAKIMMGMQDD